MKNNIKKRPRFSLSEFKGTKQQCLDQMRFLYEKWFEDFERELRELLKREKYEEKGYCPVWDNAYDYAIKQVLGDS